MTQVLTQPAPSRPAAATEPDVTHIVCCHDDDLALCGADLADVPWGDDGLPCVVCEALDAAENANVSGWCDCPCCVPLSVEVVHL